ncbi:hypothetical protein TNCT_632091 [Trichonephila clavata]|nr:hypothetical protein TNCT_176961 [Trichonephila clavata]GFR02366.1 hypothetical protein TNCT_176991 [Trichonephila clavata]GFR02379.1 hypothetical protein TNCT_177051 [Trichonephila clavata]GFR15502.1 hypothetical protein TNCT_632091 [Trichonephila clavata]
MRKPSDASVAFGGARPKIYPRNTFPYGDAVMEKTKSKKRRQSKDRKHPERKLSDKEIMDGLKNLPVVPTDVDISPSPANLGGI